jgi:hypothetical protein
LKLSALGGCARSWSTPRLRGAIQDPVADHRRRLLAAAAGAVRRVNDFLAAAAFPVLCASAAILITYTAKAAQTNAQQGRALELAKSQAEAASQAKSVPGPDEPRTAHAP